MGEKFNATRQSAAAQTADEYADQFLQRGKVDVSVTGTEPEPVKPKIGSAEVQNAVSVLLRYKARKADHDKRVLESEEWYRKRHWDYMGERARRDVEPASAWLFNSIANKHADAMDNYPMPNILPREAQDEEEATRLSSIVPVILQQCNFEEAYSECADDKLITGTGVYGVFWDPDKYNGIGDVAIKAIDITKLFWEPGVDDIQNSRNVFYVSMISNEVLLEQYPSLDKSKLGNALFSITRPGEEEDTAEMSPIVDWYYKRMHGGKVLLHFCKFVGDTVLYASENEPAFTETGYYEHGMYPFVPDKLYRIKGSVTGFGVVDVGKDAQEYIDRGNQAILMNLLANTKPRHFIRSDGSVNEEEYADLSKDFVHVDSNLGQDSIVPIQGKPLQSIYLSVVRDKIDELKETTGNRDISSGGTTSGVTAASAIAAMQEAGSKLSRDSNKSSYRAFRKVVELVVELIRQFYTIQRQFRIIGKDGVQRFVIYSNEKIREQYQGENYGIDYGFRKPLFDIEISAEKASPYSKLSQNELALQFYSAGFFRPDNATQALMCLKMMDFTSKDEVMQAITANLQALMVGAPVGTSQPPRVEETKLPTEESSVTRNARERVAESTEPR